VFCHEFLSSFLRWSTTASIPWWIQQGIFFTLLQSISNKMVSNMIKLQNFKIRMNLSFAENHASLYFVSRSRELIVLIRPSLYWVYTPLRTCHQLHSFWLPLRHTHQMVGCSNVFISNQYATTHHPAPIAATKLYYSTLQHILHNNNTTPRVMPL
jgi:hypothetical protein